MSAAGEAPSTLIERSQALRTKVARIRSSESNEHTIRAWQPLREGLPEQVDRLERLLNALRLLRLRGLLPAGSVVASKDATGLVAKLADIRERLLHRPATVIPNNRWANLEGRIRGAAKALEQTLETTWKSYLAGLAPNLDDWEPFFQADRFGAQVRQINTLRAELQGLARSLPESEEVLARAEAKSAQIHELVRKMDFGDIPPAVKKFIEQVTSPSLGGGATLADLDGAVLKWLRDKGLAQGFRVAMGGR